MQPTYILATWAKKLCLSTHGHLPGTLRYVQVLHYFLNVDTNKTGKPSATASPDLPDSSPSVRSTRGRAAVKLGSNGKFVYMICVHVHVHVYYGNIPCK